MKKPARIILEYFLAFVVIILLLITITGVVVVKFYGDEMQEYVMELVNKRLDTKAEVGEVSVKVLHKFPNTSLLLKDVTIWSSHNCNIQEFEQAGADTLLTARSVSISFNLLGMVRRKFEIREVEIREGSLNLLTDSEGEGNYRLRKDPKDKENKGGAVDLSQFRISDFHVRVINLSKQIEAEARLDDFELNGRFTKRNTQIKGSLKGYLERVSNKGILYGSQRDVEVRLNMDVQDSILNINDGQIQIDRILADVDGMISIYRGQGVDLDLIAEARNLEIHEILDLLPIHLSKPVQQIRGNGILQLYTRISGRVSSTLKPSIEADFQTSNANLFWEKVPFSLKNLNLSGSYSNGGQFSPVTTRLTIDQISAVIGKDHFSGKGQIYNFFEPDFSFDLKGDLHPKQWLNWYPSIPLDQADGSVITDIRVKGSYDRQKPRGEKFPSFDISGGIALEDVLLGIKPKMTPFTNLNGSVRIDNDFWEPSFSGMYGSTDFEVNGSGLNLLSYIQGEEKLVASATFRSHQMDLQEILDQLPGKRSPEKKAVSFPKNMDLKLDFVIDNLNKKILLAENVRGVALYDSPSLLVESLSLQSMEGTLQGSFGLVQADDKGIFSKVEALLYNLDIGSLFEAFNNFGQKQLTHEHLKGSISGTTAFSSRFDSTFSIIPESIISESDIIIRDGELNNFTPIMALSRFIEVEELENIRFSTLENTILIKDSQVSIPGMDIQSNALDLSASGIHSFNNLYDYRLKLKLSHLLYGKARKSKNSEFVIAEDESDTRILFLKIYDDGSGSKVEMDREKAAEKVREDMKQEKLELKKILNEELGWFKKDTGLIVTPEKEESFQFDFSEDQDTISLDDQVPDKGKWRRRRQKKDTVQNKPATKFVIDE